MIRNNFDGFSKLVRCSSFIICHSCMDLQDLRCNDHLQKNKIGETDFLRLKQVNIKIHTKHNKLGKEALSLTLEL